MKQETPKGLINIDLLEKRFNGLIKRYKKYKKKKKRKKQQNIKPRNTLVK